MKNETCTHKIWTWKATGAVCSFAGGIGAALLGSVLTASLWILGAPAHPWIHAAGTALLIVTIPLLIFSGYCLDWADADRTKSSYREGHSATN